MKQWLLLFALIVASPLIAAVPDEATGLVIHVADGDTFTVEGLGEVRLADINCPELDVPGGPEAKEFTREKLLDKRIYLDIDDDNGRDQYGRYICIAYVTNLDGTDNSKKNFNRMLVDSGHAIVEDDRYNEFNPIDWWKSPSENPQAQEDRKFVGTIRSNKYHYPECKWAKEIKPENEIWFTSSEDARSQYYVPCGVCHPP